MCIQYVYQCLSDGLQAWWFFKKIIKMLTNNIQNNVKADQKEIKKQTKCIIRKQNWHTSNTRKRNKHGS